MHGREWIAELAPRVNEAGARVLALLETQQELREELGRQARTIERLLDLYGGDAAEEPLEERQRMLAFAAADAAAFAHGPPCDSL